MKKYKYIGEGKGVPGLPHELTELEVAKLGEERLLADALANGQYEVIEEAGGYAPPRRNRSAQRRKKKEA